MSQAALLQAVRDKIQTALSLDANSCEVGFTGEPKPMAGELYVSVHPGSWTPDPDVGQSGDVGFGEVYGCQVTVTRRLGYSPKDRWGIEVLVKAVDGLSPILRRIMAVVVGGGRYDVLIRANTTYLNLATDDDPNGYRRGFIEPLRFQDGGRPEPKGPDWFNAEPADVDVQEGNAGISQTLSFGGAKRQMCVDSLA